MVEVVPAIALTQETAGIVAEASTATAGTAGVERVTATRPSLSFPNTAIRVGRYAGLRRGRTSLFFSVQHSAVTTSGDPRRQLLDYIQLRSESFMTESACGARVKFANSVNADP